MKHSRLTQNLWVIETCNDYMAKPRRWALRRAGPFPSRRAAMTSAAWFRFLDVDRVSACRAVRFSRAPGQRRS